MALSFKQLSALLEVKRPSDMKRLLKARGIRWIPDRLGRPTTSDAEYDRAISGPRRKVTFTKPPICNKKSDRYLRASVKNTARTITSTNTNGQSYAG